MNLLLRACLIIDAIDEPLLAQHSFYLTKSGYYRTNVRLSNGKQRTKSLHQLILGDAQNGMVIDHINRDKSDNRRANLRFVTRSQNSQNQTLQKTSSSGFRGVSFHRQMNKWQAHCGGKYLGSYLTREEAATVARAARRTSMTHSED